MTDNGYNPMRYDCEKSGCFNRNRRPKIEVFSECFPGRINFGDIDAEVEINGYSLRLEWKSHAGNIPKGQEIMFARKTRYGIDTIFCVCGDAATMDIDQVGIYWLGRWRGWKPMTLFELKKQIAGWAEWAGRQPNTTTIAGIMACILRQFKLRDQLNYIAGEVGRREMSSQTHTHTEPSGELLRPKCIPKNEPKL